MGVIKKIPFQDVKMLKHRYHQLTSRRPYGDYDHGYVIKACIPVLELTLRDALQVEPAAGGAP